MSKPEPSASPPSPAAAPGPAAAPSRAPATSPAGGRPDYDSPTALSRLLDTEGLAMSKRFGQNFLVNRRSRERILEELGGAAGEGAWEIGPGIGSMTAMALDAGLAVTAFEIDHGFARLLSRAFGAERGFTLVEGDFLHTWKGALAAGGPPDLIFGNLPYNAAAAIIAVLLESGTLARRMVFTVQKEAAQRMAASPGTKDYSAFTVLCASTCKVRLAFDLGAASFWPQPRVTSSVVTLLPRAEPLLAEDRKGFSRFVRMAFSSRRKTLRNNLKAGGYSEAAIDAALDGAGLGRSVRAEVLAPEALAGLYRGLSKAG